MPVEDVPDEVEEVANAPAISGTLKPYNCLNNKCTTSLFLEFYPRYYCKPNNPVVCGHVPFKG